LQRIVENQGFEFKIAILPKDNQEIAKFIDDVNAESLKEIKATMIQTLDNENSVKLASVPKTGLIAEISANLFKEITK